MTAITWTDVHDPHNEIQIRATFHMLQGKLSPSEIQEMINENGVPGMVKEVNQYLKKNHIHWTLVLHQNIVVEAFASELA